MIKFELGMNTAMNTTDERFVERDGAVLCFNPDHELTAPYRGRSEGALRQDPGRVLQEDVQDLGYLEFHSASDGEASRTMKICPPGGAKHREKGETKMREIIDFICFLLILREPEVYDD